MRKETVKKIRNFFQDIQEFKVNEFILFGSRIRGDFLRKSDLDVIVVSEDFAKVKFPERANIFYGKWDDEIDLDFICYTPQEIAKKKRYKGLVSTAFKEGLHFYC